jgi:hypothetical protein
MNAGPEKFGRVLSLREVFERVNKQLGSFDLACHDMKQALADGTVAAIERRTDGTRNSGKREPPKEFWQTAEITSYDGKDVWVESEEHNPDREYFYFLRQHDAEQRWPANHSKLAATVVAEPSRFEKSAAGAKAEYDWEKILIEAAAYIFENGPPKSLKDLCDIAENWFEGRVPGETQLKEHLRPLYLRLKKLHAK